MSQKTYKNGDGGKRIVFGVAISYILSVFNAVYSLVITPYFVEILGAGDY